MPGSIGILPSASCILSGSEKKKYTTMKDDVHSDFAFDQSIVFEAGSGGFSNLKKKNSPRMEKVSNIHLKLDLQKSNGGIPQFEHFFKKIGKHLVQHTSKSESSL